MPRSRQKEPEFGAGAKKDDRIVAVGLLAETTLKMLGSSLKKVFRVEDHGGRFEPLLHALDDAARERKRRLN